jgi:NADH dehydrogenase/NADH:ubiquinone oxidoreductase subunit G
MVAANNPEVDDGWLCDYGRFDTLPSLSGRPTSPLVRRNGSLEPASWDQALARAAELLGGDSPAVLASASLTNEAIWVLAGSLSAVLPRAVIGFYPQAAEAPLLEGPLTNLPSCGRILLLGLDPWSELPILALWLRKATLRGGKLVVIGPKNGLFRDTAAWLRVESEQIAATAQGLLRALDGHAATDDSAEAAKHLEGDGPAAVLAGQGLLADQAIPQLVRELAERLGARPSDGMVGSPGPAANTRGVQELAPDLSQANAGIVHDMPGPLLLLGSGPWPAVPEGPLVLATSSPFEERQGLEVLLPLAHPYEQAGSVTSLEGRVQKLNPGGIAPPMALADWEAVTRLANALGARAPVELAAIRAAISAEHPGYLTAMTPPSLVELALSGG